MRRVALQSAGVIFCVSNWIFDRYRDIPLNEFDYSYSIKKVNYEQGSFELLDGSVWSVAPKCTETSGFYAKRYPKEGTMPEYILFTEWQDGDTIIFHRLKGHSTFLAYNVSRDRLLDVLPVAAPSEPVLTIATINNTKNVSYGYRRKSLTKNAPLERYKVVNRDAFIVLSDGSRWDGKPTNAIRRWIVGDPVHVIHNLTISGSKTHMLMHFKATKKHPNGEPKFDRLSVFRAA